MTNRPPGEAGRKGAGVLLPLVEGLERWFIEKHAPYTGHLYGVQKTFFRGRSPFQEIEVVELAYFGKTLILDGKIQSTEDSEWIYHEMLVHPALVAHERPERVLIIGGGEGATAREVLKHSTVKALDMVELDVMVYEVCRRYLPEFSAGAFEDPRFSLVVGDGRRFVESLSGRRAYDVVVVDATDPLRGGPSYLLYTEEFYRAVKGVLKPGGIMVTQAEDISTSPSFSTCTISIYKTVEQVFPVVRYYLCWVPSFDGEWSFVLGSLGPDPAQLPPDVVRARLETRGVKDLRYYTPELHASMFNLPGYVREFLERHPFARVIKDDKPLFVYAEERE